MDRRSVGDGDRELAGEWLPVRTLQAASMLLGRRRCAVAAQSPIYDQAAGDKHPRMPILAQAHAGGRLGVALESQSHVAPTRGHPGLEGGRRPPRGRTGLCSAKQTHRTRQKRGWVRRGGCGGCGGCCCGGGCGRGCGGGWVVVVAWGGGERPKRRRGRRR